MASEKNTLNGTDSRLDWIDPTVTTLQLSETAAQPIIGGDGAPYVDCSRS